MMPSVAKRQDLAGTGVLLIFALLAAATLVPLWRDAGWPINHDNAFGQRTEIYARHFAAFDLLPIWSSVDAGGFGSPMPLMYHKLFFIAAGLLALAGESLKSADTTVLWLFLIAGASGLYLTMRAMGGSRLAAAVAGCCLITANYTITNWLVRGAVAEFSGSMIAAWALFFLVKSINAGRVHSGLGIVLGLLWLAHSVLAFYVGLLFAATYLLLATAGIAPWSLLNPRTGWRSVAWFTLILTPYLASMAVLSRRYDFNRILIPYQPVNEFRPFLSYLWERNWHFGRTVSGLTVQLDHPMLALLVVGLCGLTAAAAGRSPAARPHPLRAVLPFMILIALALFLQLPASAPFYLRMPGAAFLQFPWRLLALLTPALIVAAVFLAEQCLPPDARLFVLGCAAAWMIAGSGAFVPLQDPRFAIDPPQMTAISFSSPYREYEPRAAPRLEELRASLAARWQEAGCAYDRLEADEEVTVVQFRTSCGRSAVLPLPLYASALHVVRSPNSSRNQRCLQVPEFPDLCGAAIQAGDGTVSVALPAMRSILRR